MASPISIATALCLAVILISVSARNPNHRPPTLGHQPRNERTTSPIHSIIEALRDGNPSLARKRFEKLPSQYAESPQNVIREASKILLRSDTETLQALFQLVAANKRSGSVPQLVTDFLEFQRSEGDLDKIEDLITGVHIISQVLNSSAEPTDKESEAKLLQLILSNLLRVLPKENYQQWEEVNSWLGNDFYRVFRSLAKTDILDNVVRSFEANAGTILERYQLEYIEKRYYHCADSKRVTDPELGVAENYFNFTECNTILKSGSTKISPSLAQDVVNESRGENSTATDVIQFRVLSVIQDYPTLGPGQNENARPYSTTINDDNLWLSYILDGVFNAVQKGQITFDPTTVGKMLRILSPLKRSLSKYPVLTDHVTNSVNRIYETTNDVHPVLKYIADLPDSLERLASARLISILKEKQPKLVADQAIVLARKMSSMDLGNDSYYNMIPDAAKLLSDLENRTVMKLSVKIGQDLYQIVPGPEGTVGLRKEGSAGSNSGTIWALKGRYADRAVLELSLIDPQTEQYGNLAYLRKEGLRHELRLKRKSGNYSFFVNLTRDESAFNLRYVNSKLPICIERDEDGKPVGLGACVSEENIEAAAFVVAKDANDYKLLLQKLF